MEETRPGEFFEITEDGGTFILNSNDLCMIEHLRELSYAGIDSFKIEGRMKSAYYTAVVTNAYRHAIIDYADVVDDEDILVVAVEMTDGYINLLVGVGA